MADPQDKDITSLERIKRIMGILRLDGREIEIHLPHYIEIAKISNTTQGMFTVKLSNPLIDIGEGEIDYIYINFIFSGVELFGKCKFIEKQRAFLTLQLPDSLKSRTRRRYPRVKLKESMTAEVKFKEFPEKKLEKISSRELPVKYSQLYWEAQRESVDIKKVFMLGLKEMKNISPYTEFVIYKKDNRNSRDARIMRKSGKVLYIDDCHKAQSYTKFIASDRIINYLYYFHDKRMGGSSQDEITKEMEEIIREDLSKGYSSKVLLPLFSSEGVIGHIKVFQKGIKNKITPENVTDLSAIAILISSGIEKAHFVTDLDELTDSSLIEISEGGLFLKIIDHGSNVRIPEGTSMEVRFKFNDKEIILNGRVCRAGEDPSSYAIKFINISSDVKKVLKDFVDKNIEVFKDQL